ncbi:PP2C family protein-serine/threonine phosphatase [candidate division KSB1 bacterium]
MDIAALEKENQHLRRAVEELAFLNELSVAISASFDSQQIMQTIIRKSIRAVKAEQGSITLIGEEEDTEMKTLVRTMVTSREREPVSLCQNMLGWMHINKKPLMIDDVQKDDRFSGMDWDKEIQSVLGVPLITKSKLTGILSVFNKKTEDHFDDDDARILAIVAAQSAQIIESARLYEEEKAFMKLREESQLAGEIQRRLLPKSAPEIPGYDIAGSSIPALDVGGDYYDFIPFGNNELAICLGDISGKGMPAALLMANLQATIRGQVLTGKPPKESIARSNDLIYMSTEANKFATLFYSILKPEENELIFTNAGHDPPILFQSASQNRYLKSGGPVLGFMSGLEYLQETVRMQPGDTIVVYSDGITEAMDTNDDEFGEDRLVQIVSDNKDISANELIEKIISDVRIHALNVPQSDDITIVIIKKL